MSEPAFSIVVETENASTIAADEALESLRALAEELQGRSDRGEVIIVHPGRASESPCLQRHLREQAPGLLRTELQVVAVENARYYELKNAGIERSTGRVVVMLDSDAAPEPGWLDALLRPFESDETLAVAGHTYLEHRCLISRTLALVWVFPLRENDLRQANRRPIYANNCAFRGAWIRQNLYPANGGFKVSCTLHAHRMRQAGEQHVLADAYAKHAPLRGFRFLLWRAWVTGRDADRKVEAIKGASRSRRLLRAVKFWIKNQARVARRVVTHSNKVDLPLWQTPVAMGLGAFFYTVAFAGQLGRLTAFASDSVEYVPDYAEAH